MKTLIFFILFLSNICYAQVAGVMTFNTLNQRFGHGVEYIVGDETWEGDCVLEATFLKRGDSIFIYNTAHDDTSAIELITTDSIGGTLNKRGIVIHTRSSGLNEAIDSAGTVYLYGVDWNGAADCYLYTSPTGYPPFTDHGMIINHTLIPNCTILGNVDIIQDTSGAPIRVGGKYQMLLEAGDATNFLFQTHRLESPSVLGPWTYVEILSSLQIGVGSWSGACTIFLDGVYYCFYHYSLTGVLPTAIAYATSTDLTNWTIREYPVKAFEFLPYGAFNPVDFSVGTSQLADFNLIQSKGSVNAMAEFVQNSNPPLMVIYRWRYRGTFKELITDLNDCIGCVGIYP